MTALMWLVPVALLLGGIGLVAFLWSLQSGQYDDLDGAAWRALDDDETTSIPKDTESGKAVPAKQSV